MGSRANYLHVRPDGTHRLLYSHWGGQRVDTDLFGGPAALIRLLDSLRDDVGWLDDRWAEGGVVIDERRRELKWFGGELVPDEPSVLEVYDRLLAAAWAGWEVSYMERGIFDMADHAGVAADVVDGQVERRVLNRLTPRVGRPGYPSQTWLSIGGSHGWRHHVIGEAFDDLVVCTHASLRRLVDVLPDDLPDVPQTPGSQDADDWPHDGLIVDEAERRLRWWSIGWSMMPRTLTGWPGWTTRRIAGPQAHRRHVGLPTDDTPPAVNARLRHLHGILSSPRPDAVQTCSDELDHVDPLLAEVHPAPPSGRPTFLEIATAAGYDLPPDLLT